MARFERLKPNRSAPDTAVIPVLYYPVVREAVQWLTTALPFVERLRIADHRSQLLYNGGAIVVATPGGHANAAPSTLQSPAAHSVMLRVTGIDALFERARASGARVLAEPADHIYGNVNARSSTHGAIRGHSRRRSSIPIRPTGVVSSWLNEVPAKCTRTQRNTTRLRRLERFVGRGGWSG